MIVFILCCTLLLAAWLWVTGRAQDAWPFSHYPMFARYTELAEVEVFRLALETRAGEVVWWHSRFYRYPERLGRELRRLHYAAEKTPAKALERDRYLLEVLRLIRLAEGDTERYRAFQIVRRSVTVDAERGWVIHEQTVGSIPLASLKGVRGGN